MLLLLESRCLFGVAAYDHAVAQVLGRYWPAANSTWLPIFLINDLVRYWTTLCLNYEGFRRTDDTVGKRRLDLLKLRYRRMWTCFSGLAYPIAGLDGDTIPRSRALEMVSLTPACRTLRIAEERPPARAGSRVAVFVRGLLGSGKQHRQEGTRAAARATTQRRSRAVECLRRVE